MLAQFIHPLEKRKVEACVCSEMGIFGGAGMDLVQLKTLGADISFGKAQGLVEGGGCGVGGTHTSAWGLCVSIERMRAGGCCRDL